MKFLDTHFDDYIQTANKVSLHPTLKNKFDSFPDDINNLKNVILYGPSGVGKYTQLLLAIKKYSPSELKYEKKLTVTYNKVNYYFKISDIHYEINMSLLGCNFKLLWQIAKRETSAKLLILKFPNLTLESRGRKNKRTKRLHPKRNLNQVQRF